MSVLNFCAPVKTQGLGNLPFLYKYVYPLRKKKSGFKAVIDIGIRFCKIIHSHNNKKP